MVKQLNKTMLLHWLEGKGARRCAVVANLIIVMLIAYALANLFWNSYYDPMLAVNPPSSSVSLSGSDIQTKGQGAAVSGNHLFGRVSTKRTCEQRGMITDKSGKCIPPTKIVPVKPPSQTHRDLRVTLNGILYFGDDTLSRAVISNSSRQQDVYAIGAIVEGKAIIKEIHEDKVVLSFPGSGNSTQILNLEEINGSSSAKPEITSKPNKRPGRKGRGRRGRKGEWSDLSMTEIRGKLIENPSLINRIVRIRPINRNKKFMGFRLSPGKERDVFERLGLKRGDIVVAVDGSRLNTAQDGMKVASKFATATELNLTVKRKGAEENVTIRF
ncbi:MAG: type II secretion system protein GspC [Gammaproteobacteria bacterium]|nr:MAG: type II secretion system protein GspC [Gammaproteobacteria bacterium]